MSDVFDQVGGGAPAGDIFDRAAPAKASDLLPDPKVVDAAATAAAHAQVGDSLRATIGAAPGPTLWQRLTAPLVGGMTGDIRAHDTPISRAAGGAQEPAESSKQRTGLVDFENAVSDVGPGVARGAAEFATGLTTPGNLLLMAGSGGLGVLEKQLGKSLVSRLVSGGFSASMLHSAYEQVPALREAWNRSDWPQVRQQLTRMALSGGMAGLAARSALKRPEGASAASEPVKPEPEYTITGQPIRPAGGDIFDAAEKEKTNVAQRAVKPGAAEAQPQGGAGAEGQPGAGAQPGVGGSQPVEVGAGAAGEKAAGVIGVTEPENKGVSAGNGRTIEAEAVSGPRPAAAVDAGAARPVDAGAAREGGAVHGAVPPGAGRVAGEDTDILVPGEDRALRARYEVRELADVRPSHVGETFAPNPKYAHRNERDYSKPENQERVIRNSSEERFDARYHITDNPDATNGPIVVDERGNALGGNNRGMILQRVYGRKGLGAAAYRQLLERKAGQFGVDAAALRGMREPVLVRVVPDAELHALPGGSKWAIRKTNVSGTAELSSSERAAADAGQLAPEMVQNIAEAIEAAGPDATLNDALTGKGGTAIVNRLIAEGFFSEQERPALMDGKTGAPTQAAKDRIGKAMLGQFFRDSDQIQRTPANVRNKIERIAAPLSKLGQSAEFDIRGDIRDAIDAMEYKDAQGFATYGDARRQEGMFGSDNPVTPRSAYFATVLEDFSPTETTAIARKYAANSVSEEGMFGSYNPTPQSAMTDAVRDVIAEQERAALAKIDKKLKGLKEGGAAWEAAQEERKQAVAGFAEKQRSFESQAVEAFGVERPAPSNQAEPPAPSTPSDSRGEPVAPAALEGIAPPAAPAESSGVYFGSGLGALEPLFREAKAEGDALRAKRNAALAAIKAARESPAQHKAGEQLRSYYTAERDLWAARANQALDIVARKVLPQIGDREAVAIMREFRHRPAELQQFIDGSHPFLQEADGGAGNAITRLDKLQPVMRQALRMLLSPTDRESKADRLYTNIASKSLEEGKKGGWLGSRWESDEYVPHLLSPKGKGDVATAPSTAGRSQGKIGKYFGFGERRSDPYPTMVHAIADGLIPKTLDPSAAFTVHADKFAQARATHLLEGQLAESGMGKWGAGSEAPEGWVPLAEHTDEFRRLVPYIREAQPGEATIEPGKKYQPREVLQTMLGDQLQVAADVAEQRLYVPEFIQKALDPITAPDWTAKFPGFSKLRTAQRTLKEAILGLSGFHLLTENVMAKADVGISGMYEALKTPRESAGFLANERDLIESGGTTSIQGSTISAYRSLRPGTIPTRGEMIRAYIPGSKKMLEVADSITRLTFDNVQRRYKVVGFALHRDAWLRDNPHATPEQTMEAKRGIASYVNGVFGGLHWENMGIPRAIVEVARAVFLAPDWSGSNIALAKYAMDARLAKAEFTRHPLAGAMTKETVQARLARAFWTKQLVQGLTENQMLSLLFSGSLSPRPFQVYQGQDKDGQAVYQNVVFRGSTGDLIGLASKMEDRGLLVGPGVFLGSKAAPFTKLAIHGITGRNDLGQEIAPKGLSFGANTVRSAGAFISDVSPIPIVARSLQKTMFGDGSDKYLWSERMLTLFGPMAQHVAPEGFRMTKNGLEEKPAREGRSMLDQILTGKP